ncbi:MAG: hypothetical protein ABFD69_02500 [Candidatus Sumerlaeia bacterium]
MRARDIILAVSLALALIAPPAFLRPMQTPDEGRYAEVARETLAAGNWLTPTLNGQPHLTKSPVYTDLVAMVFKIFGASTFTSRLVSIAAFVGLLVFSMLWAQKHGGPAAGRLSALVSLTMFYPIMAAQFGDLNMLFSALVAIGLALLGSWILNDGKAAWLGAWIALGLAGAVKGPPVVGMLLGTLLIYRLLGGRPFGKKAGWWALGAAIMIGIGVSWYAWIVGVNGAERMKAFWFEKALERTSLNEDSKPLYYHFFYLPVFLVLSSGWGVCMLQLWARAIKARRSSATQESASLQSAIRNPQSAILGSLRSLPASEQWLLAWLAATLLLFSIMRAHMLSYIQPAYHAAALLLALYGARRAARPGLMKLYKGWAVAGLTATVLATFGAAAFLGIATLQGNLKAGKYVEHGVIARTMASFPRQDWDLIQCDRYSPTFSFLTKRISILCDHQIHKQWPMPPELSLDRRDLRRRLESGKPAMVVVRRKDAKKFFPEPVAGVRALAQGDDLMLLTNMPEPAKPQSERQ